MELLRSVAGKLILLTVIFIVVPILIYQQLQQADEEKTRLLLRSIQEQGKTLAIALEPSFGRMTPETFDDVTARLVEFGGLMANIKILLRPPNVADPSDFYYVASLPGVPKKYRDEELDEIKATGILDRVDQTCTSQELIARRYRNPDGEDEIVSSIVPVRTGTGCWLVMTSIPARDLGDAAIDKPLWARLPVQFSFAIYFGMAALALALLIELRRNLFQFTRLARRIRRGTNEGVSFRTANRIPELNDVAVEFDGMVQALTTSAEAIRTTAEETAHALKTPVGILAQAIEPLRRTTDPADDRGRKSLQRMDTAIERLGQIVDRNRRIEEITAESLNPALKVVDLAGIVRDAVEQRRAELDDTSVAIDFETTGEHVEVSGNARLIASAVDNLIENALSFSPDGGRVAVAVRRTGRFGTISVSDMGPGVPDAELSRIFERNYSRRSDRNPEEHYGLGLWIVRRNMVAMDGSVTAENIAEGGFRVTLNLPRNA